jgi:carboxypeptidase C (cathepsin A)
MLRAVVAIACVLIASVSTSLAQTGGTGAIAGTVRDQTGAGIPEADVIVRSAATNEIRQVKTQLSGTFVCLLLLPGDYTLEVRMGGFAPLTRDGIRVTVTETTNLAIELRVEGVTDTVRVSGAPEIVQSGSNTLGRVVDSRAVEGLPLVTRNFTQIIGLSLLEPQRATETGARSVTVRGYAGGHATYTDDPVRLDIKRDVAAFLRRAVNPARGTSTPAPPPPTPPPPASTGPASAFDDAPSATHHEITIGGRTLRYTATAGLLPIRHNETGEPHGNVFFVAYSAGGAQGARRPLTFLWNGGPGSNSTLLHLMGFGPKRLGDSRSPAACVECEVHDNEATWLEQSDLVFVDPVGTGFSRPIRAEYGAEFYNTLGDIASIAEFVRVYLTRFDAWDAPIFIAGESYGAWRASGVAEALEQRGTRVAGVMLISGGIHVGPVLDGNLRTALFIPTRAAAAFHHRKLGPDLQKDLPTTLRTIETWALNEYGPALKRLASLSDQDREAIASAVARFTGLDPTLVDRQTLVVGRQQFAEQLLRDRKGVLARFDTRDVEGTSRPSNRGATVNRYLRSALAFKTDLAYQGIEDGFTPQTGQRVLSVAARWNYNQGPQPAPGGANAPPATPPTRPANLDAPPGGAQPWLRRAMVLNPSLKAFAAAGLYDSLNSCAYNARLVSRLEQPFAGNITAKCYDGGHMMYDEPAIRRQVTSDVAAFYQSTLGSKPSPRN